MMISTERSVPEKITDYCFSCGGERKGVTHSYKTSLALFVCLFYPGEMRLSARHAQMMMMRTGWYAMHGVYFMSKFKHAILQLKHAINRFKHAILGFEHLIL